jgi:inorganic pyrophosphatase
MILPPAFTSKNNIHVIIETPRGSRNKYNFHEETGLFFLKKVLPLGLSFPLDFGFIPHTRAEDKDPMDALVFMEEPGFPGCLVKCRVIGIITAEQKKDTKKIRNDRVLAIATESKAHAAMQDISDVSKELLEDVMRFFESYHEREGDQFKALAIEKTEEAIKQIKKNLES